MFALCLWKPWPPPPPSQWNSRYNLHKWIVQKWEFSEILTCFYTFGENFLTFCFLTEDNWEATRGQSSMSSAMFFFFFCEWPLLGPPRLLLTGMCNARFKMTLTAAAFCSPALNHSHTWASDIMFVCILDQSPYVQSVPAMLFFFFCSFFREVWRWKPAEGRWVRLLAWVWAGHWGVKGWCVWAFSTCWLNMTQPGWPRDLQSCTFWCTGVHAIIVWTLAVLWLPAGHH